MASVTGLLGQQVVQSDPSGLINNVYAEGAAVPLPAGTETSLGRLELNGASGDISLLVKNTGPTNALSNVRIMGQVSPNAPFVEVISGALLSAIYAALASQTPIECDFVLNVWPADSSVLAHGMSTIIQLKAMGLYAIDVLATSTNGTSAQIWASWRRQG